MSKRKEEIPRFKDEDQEREFWSSHDSAEIINWPEAEKVVFPNLIPTTKTISLRLPEFILDELKLMAHKRDVPYQSLIKLFLKERIDQELSK